MFERNFGRDEGRFPCEHGFAEIPGFNNGPFERSDRDFGDRMHRGFDVRMHRGFGGFGGGRERLFEAGDLAGRSQTALGAAELRIPAYKNHGAASRGWLHAERWRGLSHPDDAGRRRACCLHVREQQEDLFGNPGRSTIPPGQRKTREGGLFDRLEDAGRSFQRGKSPEIMKAFHDMHLAVFARLSRDEYNAGTNPQNYRSD